MDIIKLVVSPLDTNCYIVKVSDSECVVIDPGDDAKKIMNTAAEAGLTITKILLTHGHFDHAGAAQNVKLGKTCEEKKTSSKKKTDPESEQPAAEAALPPIYIHKADECMLKDKVKALAFFCPGKPFTETKADVLLNDGDTIEAGNVTFTVMHTPGHSAGSVCYICTDEDGQKIMFAGDTIFKDSIGRSDCYSGDYIIQQESLDKLKALEGDYIIYPGHGPETTLNEEKRFNPFLSDF